MERKKVLFYGAGQHAAMIYRHACRKSASYGEPTAFIDRDIYKQGHDLFGLPVISWEEAQRRYGDDFYIYVTGNEKAAPQIIGFLLESGISQERIINYEPVEKRLGCGIAESLLNLVNTDSRINFVACSTSPDNLKFQEAEVGFAIEYTMANQPDTTHQAMQYLRSLSEKIRQSDVGLPHSKCMNRRVQYYFKNQKLRKVHLGGVERCNFKCSYCFYDHKDYKNPMTTFPSYEIFIEMFQKLEQEQYIDEDTVISMANGEFSISKAGNEFVELVSKYPTVLLTNAYLYSPQAEKALEYSGIIFCSVDAGTPETFHRVKGVDGFERVSENLREYAKHGPVSLKYILLDGVNDSMEDLYGFFHLADEVAVRVDLARNFMDVSNSFSDQTLEFAARFIKHFRDQGRLNMPLEAFVRAEERERLQRKIEEL